MTLCISKGKLITIDGAAHPTPNTTDLWPIKLFSSGYKVMSDNNIYSMYHANPLYSIKLNINGNAIDNDNINIIARNNLSTLLQYNNNYYCNYLGHITHFIGAIDNISVPVTSENFVGFAYIDYSDNNKLFITRPVSVHNVSSLYSDNYLRTEIDTGVNIIFLLTYRNPNKPIICYQKNNVIINCNMTINNGVVTVEKKNELCYDTYFSASVYTNQFLYYDDDDDNCFCVFLYDNNLYKIFMSTDNIPAVQKIYLDYQIIYIKNNDYNRSIIYLQTTDNYIIKFNVNTFENMIVATDCSFFVANNRFCTKKSQ